MKTRRFHVDRVGPDGTAVLDERESRHARSVLRLSAGDRVEVFDDTGSTYTAVIIEMQPGKVLVRADPCEKPARELSLHAVFAVAPPKGRRLEFMLQKLCELGVSEWIPLRCRRSQNFPSASRLGRLEKIVIEAAKQCGRSRVPALSPPATLEQLSSTFTDYQVVYAADPAAPETLVHHAQGWTASPGRILVMVGPEGGFVEEELQWMRQHGAVPVNLGRNILRIETAALAAMAVLAQTCVP